jgi:hypothetical protein
MAFDHSRRCSAKVTRRSGSIADTVVVAVDVVADDAAFVVVVVKAVSVGLEAGVLLRRRSDLFVFGFVNVATSPDLLGVVVVLVLKAKQSLIVNILEA